MVRLTVTPQTCFREEFGTNFGMGTALFLTSCRQIPGQYLDWTTITAFHILSSLLLTNHPTIQRYKIWNTDTVAK
jgi:hypothetical protein